MWLNVFMQELIDVARSKPVSGPVRVSCMVLISLLFLTGLTGLFLLVFVIEGQSLLRRGFFLVVGLIILVYYLRFFHAVVSRRKDREKP